MSKWVVQVGLLVVAITLSVATQSLGAVCDPYGSDADRLEQVRQCGRRSRQSAIADRRPNAVPGARACYASCSGCGPKERCRVLASRVRCASRRTRSAVARERSSAAASSIREADPCACRPSAPAIAATGIRASLIARRDARCSPPGWLVASERCGNGRLDEGEECDPPNGTTCSTWCAKCASSEATTLACTDIWPASAAIAALPGSFLATFDTTARTGQRALAVALDRNAKPLGSPFGVATAGENVRRPIQSYADSIAADETGFYVAWSETHGFDGLWQGRRVSASGAPSQKADVLLTYSFGGPGMCGPSYVRGPLGLATALDGIGVHFTVVRGQRCGFERIEGVPFSFNTNLSTSEPQTLFTSTGRGVLARAAHDVAALWLVNEIPYQFPADESGVRSILYGGWIEPGAEPAAFEVLPDASVMTGVSSLAAVGDLFLAAFPTATGIRGIRFSRQARVIDGAPGRVLAETRSQVENLVATSDGEHFVLGWRERRAPTGLLGEHSVIRVVRVRADGSVVDREPVDVATTASLVSFGLAADASAIVVVFGESTSDRTIALRAVSYRDRSGDPTATTAVPE